jgi:hypothetical protein
MLIALACQQVFLAVIGLWTTRHSWSFAVVVVAFIVLHPVLDRKRPMFGPDLTRSWRVYVGLALIVLVNLIEEGILPV